MTRLRGTLLISASTLVFLASGCVSTPSIEFTEVPEASLGGEARMGTIAGRARGVRPGQRVVLFARSGAWWVQPFSKKPFTEIARGSWKTKVHLGTEYAALLVKAGYVPPATAVELPKPGGDVLAVATVKGKPSTVAATEPLEPEPKTLQFSGYEWDVMQIPSDSGGVLHANRASNVWVDSRGRLHLKVVREGGGWACSEIGLKRSLGYGVYSFTVGEMPELEPATTLRMFTWDVAEPGQNHREIDIEVSQWGDPQSKNAQFTIQPYYVAANVFRFNAPPGPLTHSFHWEPGRVSFKTARRQTVAEHVFTSGIPSPGGETVHLNLNVYGKTRTPQQRGVEVVIDKFEYLP